MIGFLRYILIGFAVSALFTAIVVAFGIGYQREFLDASDGLPFLTYLFFLNGLVFAAVSFVLRVIRRQRTGYPRYVGQFGDLKHLFRPRNFLLFGIVLFILSIQYFMNFVTFPYPDAPAHIRANNSFHTDVAFLIFFASVVVTAMGLVWLLVLVGWTFASPKRHVEAEQPDR